MKRMIIAIDGPAASGKSTAAKYLAQRLSYVYIDTGAMYRACALAAHRGSVDIDDTESLAKVISSIKIDIVYDPQGNRIYLNGEDVSEEIRTPLISSLSSKISAKALVREKMVQLQRDLGKKGGVVLDGRDIGTVVFPDADLKFFFEASLKTRAKRRYEELLGKGLKPNFDDVQKEMQARDLADSTRDIAPLMIADDAIIIDTGVLTIEEMVDKLYKIAIDKAENPIEVRLARHSGFCFGVKRAIDLAKDASKNGEKIYTYGALIHNPRYIRELEDEGIEAISDLSRLRDSVVIIRSHGIPKEDYLTLEKQGNTLIDATCPYVKKTHRLIKQANEEGYPVFIFGNKEHPEVKGIRSYGDERTRVVAPKERVETLGFRKLCVISQTTQKIEDLNEMVAMLLPLLDEIKVYNTICLATSQRQSTSEALAKESDLMVVVGGKESSNTKMLAEICSKYCTTIHIESEKELKPEYFEGKQHIGICAGASSPGEHIVSVYNEILKINGEGKAVRTVSEIPLFKEESC